MNELVNLVVDLDDRFSLTESQDRKVRMLERSRESYGMRVDKEAKADEHVLAWIDDVFGGYWSSEARAGTNVIAWKDGRPIGFATYEARGFRFKWLRGLGATPGVAIFGPIGVVRGERGYSIGKRLLQYAMAQLRNRGYARALIPAVGKHVVSYYERKIQARVAERFDRAALLQPRPRVVVLASGNGSNLQAVIDASQTGDLPIDLVALVTNHAQAYAIERARAAAIPSINVMPWKKSEESREQYDARLFDAVAAERPDLVLLLGWMHLLDDRFVRGFPELLNLHPAFLPLDPERDEVGTPDGGRIPAFRGARAARDALAAGSGWAGATLHRVTAATDRGEVVIRKPLRIVPGESESELMARLHSIEHGLVRAGIARWLYERP